MNTIPGIKKTILINHLNNIIMTSKEFQILLHNLAGLKISVRKGKGSMKGYFIFWPQFQNGEYPKFDFDMIKELGNKYPGEHPHINTFSTTEVCFYGLEFEENVKYKKESKPKEISEMKIKTWRSKNSQLRLDKATARNAKRMNKGNTARYW